MMGEFLGAKKNPWSKAPGPAIPVNQGKVVGGTVKGDYRLSSVSNGEFSDPIQIDQDEIAGDGDVNLIQSPLKKIYCAGPMQGYPGLNFAAFDEARDWVNTTTGYEAISPADMDRKEGFVPDGEVTVEFFQDCMRRDLKVITGAYAILLLKGWENSTGANNELFVARACGLIVFQACYDLDGKINGWINAPEWLRSPLIYGDDGYFSYVESPRSDLLDSQEAEKVAKEVDQTLQYPPDAAHLKEADKPERPVAKKDPNILEEANYLIYGPRLAAYSHPSDDFARTAKIWEAILGVDEISPESVGLCMIGVKLAREVHKHKRDSLVDIAGYAGTVQMVHESRDSAEDS